MRVGFSWGNKHYELTAQSSNFSNQNRYKQIGNYAYVIKTISSQLK